MLNSLGLNQGLREVVLGSVAEYWYPFAFDFCKVKDVWEV